MFELGDLLRDRVSGLQGVAMCRSEYLYGCFRWGIAPREVESSKPAEWVHFDEPQLELVEAGVVRRPNSVETTGGPRPDAPAR